MTWPHGPLVLAPMAGGPGSPELVAAVSEAGLFGFLPAGYLSATDLESRITAIRALTAAPFGVNVFVPSPDSPLAHTEAMGYAARLAPWAADAGVELGRP
ncbi:MAG: nitronate monooxygenase, partial [Tetrasphaera sp.]|nr:nitronate monooxygenase [Tetrasphaera sp.]